MKTSTNTTSVAKVDCCPPLEPCKRCDTLDIKYRLPFRPRVGQRVVPVEVTLHYRLTRCSEGLGLGDLVYSTTLLPGEKVRIRTSDRHTRYSFDSETSLAYRHEATSEESFFMAGMASAVSDVTSVESSVATSAFNESSFSAGGGASLDLVVFEIGGGASGSSYSASSLNTFARSASRHAESSSRHVELGVRTASSTSVGEVDRRTHTQSESEDHFESYSREFANPNRCHAVTFLFYKIDKCQEATFELVAIERRVEDGAAPTGVVLRPRLPATKVSVLPQSVPAVAKSRLEIERNDRISRQEGLEARSPFVRAGLFGGRAIAATAVVAEPVPLPEAEAKAALDQVDKELVAAGLLDDKTHEVSKAAQERLGWKRTFSLPTAGMLVRGCLDDCDICEPALQDEIKVDLERKRLENELLRKRIELLEKSQEYRCCPKGEAEEEEADA